MARDVEEVDGVVDSARGRERRGGGDALDGAAVDWDVEGAAELGGLLFGFGVGLFRVSGGWSVGWLVGEVGCLLGSRRKRRG